MVWLRPLLGQKRNLSNTTKLAAHLLKVGNGIFLQAYTKEVNWWKAEQSTIKIRTEMAENKLNPI